MFIYSKETKYLLFLLKTAVLESSVSNDSACNVLLTTNTDVFTTRSSVSKLFVENIVSELRK